MAYFISGYCQKNGKKCEHVGAGRVCFPEKVMSHYEIYKVLPCIEKLTVYRQKDRQNYRQTDRQLESIEELRS